MDNEPLVSIITPMYKGASLVGQTIESVLAQSYQNWEMIIVDDCSPDDGAGIAVVQSYAEKDERVKIIAAKVNKGSSGARNEAMRNAKGQYFAFLDSDDIWHSNYLSVMMEKILSCKEENAAIYFSGYRRMDDNCQNEVLTPFAESGTKNLKRLLKNCPIFPSAAIVDTGKLKEKVFFREELRALRDDYVYWLDIMKQDLVAVGFDDILVDYRMRGDSMTSSKTKMIKPQWLIYRKVLKLNIFLSLYYLFAWGLNGLKKYSNKLKYTTQMNGGGNSQLIYSLSYAASYREAA